MQIEKFIFYNIDSFYHQRIIKNFESQKCLKYHERGCKK